MNPSFSNWPSYTKEEIKKVNGVLLSNKVNYWTGNQCRLFEKEFSTYFNTKYSVALAKEPLLLMPL